MESFACKLSPSDRKRVMKELIRGRGLAEKLGETLAGQSQNENNPPDIDGGLGLTQQDLTEKLLKSFNNVLSVLSPKELEEPQRSSDDSEGSVRSSLATSSDRRGCHKRRGNGDMWTKLTPMIRADDYQWRKYGQKSINNVAHPRSYFRCTHQTDKGCPATKHVQKISEDPVMFCTTYQGCHTCTDDRQLESLEISFDSGGDVQGNGSPPFFLSFNRNHTIGDPAKNEQIHVASSSNNYPGIFGPKGNNSNLYSNHIDVVSNGRQDGLGGGFG